MNERRATSRRRVCFGGLVRVATFLPEIDCALRDVSLEGACIRLAAETTLPAVCDLAVPVRGETKRARIVWRAGDRIGLRFEDAAPDSAFEAATAGDLERRLAESEAEVTRLRSALTSVVRAPVDSLH